MVPKDPFLVCFVLFLFVFVCLFVCNSFLAVVVESFGSGGSNICLSHTLNCFKILYFLNAKQTLKQFAFKLFSSVWDTGFSPAEAECWGGG